MYIISSVLGIIVYYLVRFPEFIVFVYVTENTAKSKYEQLKF